jgi:hypothetical protein
MHEVAGGCARADFECDPGHVDDTAGHPIRLLRTRRLSSDGRVHGCMNAARAPERID